MDCVIVTWGYGDEKAYNDDYPVAVVDDILQLYDALNINYF